MLHLIMNNFIALIRPIQSAQTSPQNSRKRRPVFSPARPGGPVLCTRQVAHHNSFLCRQHDVMASFHFAQVLCTRNFYVIIFFCGLLPGFCDFEVYYGFHILWRVYRLSCLHLDKRGVVVGLVAMLW